MSIRVLIDKILLRKTSFTVTLIIVFIIAAIPAVAIPKVVLPSPITSYTVRLDFEGQTVGLFSEIRFAGTESDVIEHKIAGNTGKFIIKKIPGSLKISNIELKHSLSSDLSMSDWRQQVVDGDIDNARRDISIYVLDNRNKIVAQWDITEAWPASLISGVDDKNAGKLNEIVTLTGEEIRRIQ